MTIDIDTMGMLEVKFSHEMFTNFANQDNLTALENLSKYINESNTNVSVIPN